MKDVKVQRLFYLCSTLPEKDVTPCHSRSLCTEDNTRFWTKEG